MHFNDGYISALEDAAKIVFDHGGSKKVIDRILDLARKLESKATVRLFFFNDRDIEARLYTNGLNDSLGSIPPSTGDIIEVDCPNGKIPYLKIWEDGTVMIDHHTDQTTH